MNLVSIVIFLKACPLGDGISLWMQKRGEDSDIPELSGSWEFPGGKVEALERPIDSALREVKEEVGDLNLTAADLFLFKFFNYQYPQKGINFFVYYCYLQDDSPKLNKGEWFYFKKGSCIKDWPGDMPQANKSFMDDFLKMICGRRQFELGEN